jgi:hypothetical protein
MTEASAAGEGNARGAGAADGAAACAGLCAVEASAGLAAGGRAAVPVGGKALVPAGGSAAVPVGGKARVPAGGKARVPAGGRAAWAGEAAGLAFGSIGRPARPGAEFGWAALFTGAFCSFAGAGLNGCAASISTNGLNGWNVGTRRWLEMDSSRLLNELDATKAGTSSRGLRENNDLKKSRSACMPAPKTDGKMELETVLAGSSDDRPN